MSEISSTVRIHDGMSPALKSMNKALNIVLNSFESLQNSSESAIDTSSIRSARTELANAAIAVNNLENELSQAGDKQKQFTKEVSKSDSAMSGLIRKVSGLAAAYISFQSMAGAVNLSDQLSQTESRLNLIVDDKGSVAELEQKIMNSANRAAASYTTTADIISKVALRAGDAFSVDGAVDMDQVILFTETLNKMYAIAGASAEEQASSMLQLTQALGSGVLRGEEFNAVFEAAPNIMQAVADYMDVPIGKLREMASEGLITSETVKIALFEASEEVNSQFESMNLTWSQIFTLMQNKAIEISDVILTKINDLANNEQVQAFAFGIVNVLSFITGAILEVFDLLGIIASFIYENWSLIAPVIFTTAAAMLWYWAVTSGFAMVQGFLNTIMTIFNSILTFSSIGWGVLTGATGAAAVAQQTYNNVLYACPLTWIILLIIALIGILYIVVAAINVVAGTTYSATGIIAGVVMWIVSLIYNAAIGLVNGILALVWSFVDPFIGVTEWILNAATGGFNSFGSAVANLIGQIISWFLNLGSVVTTIIDAIFGTNWTGGLNSLKSSVLKWGKNETAITLDRSAPSLTQIGVERMDMTDSYKSGYNFGKGVSAKVSGAFTGKGMKIPNIPDIPNPEDYVTSMPSNVATSPAVPSPSGLSAGGGKAGAGKTTDDIAGKTGKIADNTDKISKDMEISDEDIKYLRDIAEQEAINRFTTAEIRIDMGGVNNIVNEKSDLDGVVTYLEERLYESMAIAAEGV